MTTDQVYTERSRSAGFWVRSLASLIDGALSFLITLFVAYQVVNSSHNIQEFVDTLVSYLAFILLPLMIYNMFHLSIFTHLFGGSPGKLITGLAVTNLSGGKLPFKKILFRHLIGYQFSWLVFGLGFLAILRDPERRAWHDKVVGSRVITRSALWPVGIIALGALIYGNFLIGTMTLKSFQSNTLLKTDAAILFSQLNNIDKKDKTTDVSKDYYISNVELYDPSTSAHLSPEFKKAHNELADEYTGDPVDKDNRASQLFASSANDIERATALNLRGWIKQYYGNFQQADNYYNQSLQYDPNNCGTYLLLSGLEDQQSHYDQATLYAQKAVDILPDYAPAHYQLGRSLYFAGQKEEGNAEVRKAAELQPGSAQYQEFTF